MKRQPLSALAASLAAVVLALALLPGDAFARKLACGAHVTRDVRLDADLRDCAGAGLVIEADRVTIDLAGHTIEGTGRGTGIVNGYGSNGHRGVTVINGSIRKFKVGLRSGGRGTTLRRLTVTKNATGGIILRSAGCTVERSTIADNGYGHGISLMSAGRCTIERNRIARHLGAGIAASRSSSNRIVANRISSNRRAGITLAGSASSTLERNSLVSNDVGIALFDGSNANSVRRNTAVANATGIAVTFGGARNRIESNAVSGSEFAGIRLAETGPANVVVRNLVTLSAQEGIRLIDSAGALVEGNAAYDNAGDGIFVDARDSAIATLRRNTANHNGDDGIDVDSGSVQIESNTTERNADLGIELPATRR